MRILLCPPLQPYQNLVDQDARALKYWPEYVNVHWKLWDEGLKVYNVSLENLVYEERVVIVANDGDDDQDQEDGEGSKRAVTAKLVDLDLPPRDIQEAEDEEEGEGEDEEEEEEDEDEEEEGGEGEVDKDEEMADVNEVPNDDGDKGDKENHDVGKSKDEDEDEDEDYEDTKSRRRIGTTTESITFMSINRIRRDEEYPSQESLHIPYRWCLESFFWILNYLCAEPKSMWYPKKPYDKGGLAFLWGESADFSVLEKTKRLKLCTLVQIRPMNMEEIIGLRGGVVDEMKLHRMVEIAETTRLVPSPTQSEVFKRWMVLVKCWQSMLRNAGYWHATTTYHAVWYEGKTAYWPDWTKQGLRQDELTTRKLFLRYLKRFEDGGPDVESLIISYHTYNE